MLPAPFGLQVQNNRTLFRVLRQKRGTHASGIQRGIGTQLARQIAAVG
jgi:hypothetical protein